MFACICLLESHISTVLVPIEVFLSVCGWHCRAEICQELWVRPGVDLEIWVRGFPYAPLRDPDEPASGSLYLGQS